MKKKLSILSKIKKGRKKQIQVSTGFTLIELLATIAILSVITSIVIYFALGIIGNAKKKSYQVTVNNIQKQASNYVLEEVSSLEWVGLPGSGSQHQCITVQHLIDSGYFKSDILESKVADDRNVLATDNIWLVRDETTKTITKNVLLVGNNAVYSSLCSSINPIGKINFEYSGPRWVRDSKDITIKYSLTNYGEVKDYQYDYLMEYDNGIIKDFDEQRFTKEEEKVIVSINDNGDLCAKINGKEGSVESKCYTVSGIDNGLPKGKVESMNLVNSTQKVKLVMSDELSGVSQYYFGKVNPSTSSVSWIDVVDSLSVEEVVDVTSEGKYYLGIIDVAGNQNVIEVDFYKTILSINNGSVTPDTVITMDGDEFEIPLAVVNPYYTFKGWYKNNRYTGSAITKYKPISSANYINTLYARVDVNRLAGGAVKITGINTYGEILTANITDTTPKADKYTYKWYYNSSNSTSGGTLISGVTGNELVIKKDYVNKYIYVVVDASRENYYGTSFNDITDTKIGKRSITVLADDNSKVYDGIALTDSGCKVIDGNLSFNDSIGCMMSSASTITNAGSVDNVISSVTVWDEKKTVEVTDAYDIKMLAGSLVVTRKQTLIPTCNTGLVYNKKEQVLVVEGEGYSLSRTKATDADTYRITANLSSNYEWSDGSVFNKTLICKIDKANPTMTVNPEKLSLIYPNVGEVEYTYDGDGSLSCGSSSNRIATCSVDTTSNKVIVTPLKNGDITMTLIASEGKNYKAVSKDVHVGTSATYTVSYNANGCGVAAGTQTTVHDSATEISEMSSVSKGKAFVKWNTLANGNGTTYNVGDKYLSPTNQNLTLYAQCNTYQVTIKYSVNGGTIKSNTSTLGLWSTNSDIVYFDGNVYSTTLNYDDTIGGYGLTDYNNSTYMFISKVGFATVTDNEWVCLSGDCVLGRTYSQSSSNYSSPDFCDASEKDCSVVLGVNWKDLTAPIIEFGKNGSGGKWIKTAMSTITVTDDGSGVDSSSLKYIYSREKTATPCISFSNSSSVAAYGKNDIYYLKASACDNDGNCTTKMSEPFKLDNTPPVITCNKSKAYVRQDIIGSTFAASNVIEPDRIQDGKVYINLTDTVDYTYLSNDKYDVTKKDDYDSECTVFAQKYFRGGTSAFETSKIFVAEDNNGIINRTTGRYTYLSTDDDGNERENHPNGDSCKWKATSCNCINGYCMYRIGYRVADEAGNYSSYKYFYYYWTHNNFTPATPNDQQKFGFFIWTWERLRSTYCKYDSASGSYTTEPIRYSCNTP